MKFASKLGGTQIDGVKGKVAPPDEMRQQTWCLFYRVVQLGLCSKTILQKLLGYSCFIFQIQKGMFFSCNIIFTNLSARCQRKVGFDYPPTFWMS